MAAPCRSPLPPEHFTGFARYLFLSYHFAVAKEITRIDFSIEVQILFLLTFFAIGECHPHVNFVIPIGVSFLQRLPPALEENTEVKKTIVVGVAFLIEHIVSPEDVHCVDHSVVV
jgi:hypothetical protein